MMSFCIEPLDSGGNYYWVCEIYGCKLDFKVLEGRDQVKFI